ncbi:MAG: anti-sigma factor [Armatimonadota bacterium]|nr:anti-sigma factor [Armatimonadota bacterium]
MNCRYVQSRLSAYLDFELSGVEQQQIRNHLEQCVECSRELESLRITKMLLRQLSVVAPSGGAERVLQRLQLETAPAPRRLFAFSWRGTRWWQFAGGFALAIAVAFWSRNEPDRPFYTTSRTVPLSAFPSLNSIPRTSLPYEPSVYRTSTSAEILVHRYSYPSQPSPEVISVVPVTAPADPLLGYQPTSSWSTLLIEPKLVDASR